MSEKLTDAEWRALRHKNVGASEVAALFDEHPQITRFELWHRKVGNLPEPDLSDDERVFWGLTLEPAIAAGIAKRRGWNIRKVRRYSPHPTIEGMGASLDYEIVAHDRGPGVLEIKTVDWLVFRGWEDGEPPLHYLLQTQHQMACTGRGWGAVGVLVGGNDLRIFEYERRPKTIEKLEAAVREFWESVRRGEPPKPDFGQDAAAIRALYGDAGGGEVDFRGNNRLPELCDQYLTAAEQEKAGKEQKEAIKAEILTIIGDASKAFLDGYTISAAAVAPKPDTAITPEMVGQVLKGRSGYRNVRITKRKEQKQAA